MMSLNSWGRVGQKLNGVYTETRHRVVKRLGRRRLRRQKKHATKGGVGIVPASGAKGSITDRRLLGAVSQ